MRWTQSLIPTHKEDPQDAETISHKLMVRGGFIRKLTAGSYSYLPLGYRVLQKIAAIIREEMNAAGANEVLLPAIHPAELWKKTGRYDSIGDVLIKFKDRHNRDLVLGPTHEEVITSIVSDEVKSYKELPLILYQIQTKFRDEPRPRFGVMRTCEFIMKDAYSFDCDVEGMEKSYQKMYDAYCRIFKRCGLPYIVVEADPGIMGGNISHEFMVPAENGEDDIAVCASCGYSASVAVAKVKAPSGPKGQAKAKKLPLSEVATPDISTVEKVSEFLKVGPEKLVKTLLYTADSAPVAVLIRGDYDVNETKVKAYLKCETLKLADENLIREVTGGPLGFSGPVGLKKVRMVADQSVLGMSNFITGANKKDAHLINVNLERDCAVSEFGDFRMISGEDPCPQCNKKIGIKKAIEIGHTFKLGTKYSAALGATFLGRDGKPSPVIMGCYGIGLNRIAASLIEASNDKDGIIWPLSISPYQVVLMPLNMQDESVCKLAEGLYKKMVKSNIDVLFDDRNQRAGIKFKDADLIGFPLKVIIGERGIPTNTVEIKVRKDHETRSISADEVVAEIKKYLDKDL